jgi:sulfate transport system substrate-binding protein
VPSQSLKAEFPVSVVDKVVDERGTRKLAEDYLELLYSPEGQEIVASYYNRPTDPGVAEKHAKDFPELRLVTVEDVFGGWDKVSKEHLAEGAILDKIYVSR